MEKIRTNHMIVEFLWKEFLEDYDFFKIEYDNVDFDNITKYLLQTGRLVPEQCYLCFQQNG